MTVTIFTCFNSVCTASVKLWLEDTILKNEVLSPFLTVFFCHVQGLIVLIFKKRKKQVLTALHYTVHMYLHADWLLMIINFNFALTSRCMIISLQTLNTGNVETCSHAKHLCFNSTLLHCTYGYNNYMYKVMYIYIYVKK